MLIQIFGTKKCSNTQKAERFFKERNQRYQFIDLKIKNISKGELQRVSKSISIDSLIDREGKAFQNSNYKYMSFDPTELILEHPEFLKTPIVCLDKVSTSGYTPEIWTKYL